MCAFGKLKNWLPNRLFNALLLSRGLWAVVVVATCFSVQAEPNSIPTPTYLVRVELDEDRVIPGSVRESLFRAWSSDAGVYKALQDKRGGELLRVLQRNLNTSNLQVLMQTAKLNAPVVAVGKVEEHYAAKGPIVPTAETWTEAPIIVAPLGMAKVARRTDSSKLPRQQQLVTFSVATPTDFSRVWSQTAKEEIRSLVIPDVDLTTLAPTRRRSVQVELTGSQLASLHKAGISTKVFRGALPVNLEATGNVGPSPLEDNLADALKRFWSGKVVPSSKPLLIIVDDSWPTDADFLATKNLIGKSYSALWSVNSDLSDYKNPPVLDRATIELSSPGVPAGTGCITFDDCNTHARRIHYSIQPLRELAKNELGAEPVDVIYVPLTKAQSGSEDILRLLWTLSYAAGNEAAPNSPFFFETDTFKREQAGFLSSIPSELTGSYFQTNWGVLTSILHFAKRYSTATGMPVVINTSWTSEDVTGFNPSLLSTTNVLLVAAAGNHCKDNACGEFADAQAPARQFISRAANSRDVVLVMNQDTRGKPTCDSSRVPTTFPVIGFDGAIHGDCGTSFSAPRVAWMLAVRLAFMPLKKNHSKEPMTQFVDWLTSRPEKPPCGSDADFGCNLLRPSEIFPQSNSKPQPTASTR